MKRNQVQAIRVHPVPPPDGRTEAECANRFYSEAVEHCLSRWELTPEESAAVIDRILQKWRSARK